MKIYLNNRHKFRRCEWTYFSIYLVVYINHRLHVCFKVGQIRILQLREQSKQRLGDKFDIRKFHDVVLECAGPLDILEKRVNEYINNTATA